jgi:hypothetical protein
MAHFTLKRHGPYRKPENDGEYKHREKHDLMSSRRKASWYYTVCQDGFFVNISLNVKNNMMSMLLTLLFTCFHLLGLGEYVWLLISSPNASLITVRVSVALLPRFAQNLFDVLLLDVSRNRIRPDT